MSKRNDTVCALKKTLSCGELCSPLMMGYVNSAGFDLLYNGI